MDYKAFVSSTFLDLKDHRAHVIEQLGKAGFLVDPMENWTSSTDEPQEFSRQRLEGCHLCVLLIARRRGHVPAGETLSITQMEYAEAKRRGISILPYVLDDHVADWPAEWDQWASDAELRRWRGEVFEQRGVERFQAAPKSVQIAPALVRWVKEEGPKTALRLYLQTVQQEHGVIKFVSLPRLEDNPDAPIGKLYVPPAVAERWVSPDSDPQDWPATVPVLDALAKHRRLVVLGDPGSGKSTLVSWLAWNLAGHHQEGSSLVTEQLGRLVPLPMILRELDVGRGITWEKLLDAFVQQPLGRLLTLTNLQRLLDKGQVMLMLDGLDEIGNPAVRRDLRDAVWKGMEKYSKCHWLLTSRVVGYEEVRFDREQAVGFTGPLPWSPEQFAKLRFVAPFDDLRVTQFATNWFVVREATEHKARTGAKELLEAVRSDDGTKRLGRIPNLLTMMALIYRIEAHLPNGRALLCNKIAEAYLLTIDRWRRIDTRASERLEDRRRWLARVGFEMQQLRSTVQADVQSEPSEDHVREVFVTGAEVRTWLAAAMKETRRDASDADAESFLDYLGKRTGLLVPRGQDQYAFLHLSFQEFFAACYLKESITTPDWLTEGDAPRGTNQSELKQLAGQTTWREVLVFLIELLTADQPKWLGRVSQCLFGPEFADVFQGDDQAQGQVLLLARLAIDPQAGFDVRERQQAIRACCRWEMAAQKRYEVHVWDHSNAVAQTLLTADQAERRAITEMLAEAAHELGIIELNLENTGVSDVEPLARLGQLRLLDLGSTGVSDIRPLFGMGQLQMLMLDHTGVSDVEPLVGLGQLEILYLTGTKVRDLTPLGGLTKLETVSVSDSKTLKIPESLHRVVKE